MPTLEEEEERRRSVIGDLFKEFPEGEQIAPNVSVETGEKFDFRPDTPLDDPTKVQEIPSLSAADIPAPGVVPPQPPQSVQERMQAITNSINQRKDKDFIEGQFLEQEIAAGTDVETGAPAGVRTELSLTSDSNTKLNILRKHFPDGVRFTPIGPIVKINGQDTLLDETGMTLKDFADLSGTALEVGGAVLGASAIMTLAPPALAASPVLIPLLAVAGALGGEFTTSTAGEFYAALKSGGMDLKTKDGLNQAMDILKNEGVNALINALINTVIMGGIATKEVTKRVMAGGPSAVRKMKEAVKDFLGRPSSPVETEFADRTLDALKQFPEIAEKATPALSTQSPLATKAQGFLKGQPGGEGLLAKEAAEREAILNVQKSLAKGRETIHAFGSDVKAILAEQEKKVADSFLTQGVMDEVALKSSKQEAIALAEGRIKQIGNKIAPGETDLVLGGEAARHGITAEFTKFDNLQTVLAKRTDDAMSKLDKRKGEHLFAVTTATRKLLKGMRLGSSRTPRGKVIESTVSKPVAETQELLKTISTPNNRTSVDELRKLRRRIDDSIGDPNQFAGMSDTDKKRIAGAISADIRRSAANAPNQQIRERLTRELDEYKNNIGRFKHSHVNKVFRKEGGPGVIADEDIAPKLFFSSTGKSRENIIAARDAMGADSEAWQVVRKSAYNELRKQSTQSMASVGGKDVVRGDLLTENILRMERNKNFDLLVPDKVEREELKRLAGLMEGQQGVDAENFLRAFNSQSKTEASIVKEMERSIDLERGLQRDFTAKIQEQLRSGQVPPELDPEQVFTALRRAQEGQPSAFIHNILAMDGKQLDDVLRALPPEARDELREHTASVLLEQGASNATEIEKGLAFARGETPISRQLIQSMSKQAVLSGSSIEKVRKILGPEKFKELSDFGFIGQSIRNIDKATDAGGAIAKGQTFGLFTRGAFMKAFGRVGGVRIFAHALLEGDEAFKKLMKRKFKFTEPSKSKQVLRASAPQIARLVSESVLADGPLAKYIEETTGKDIVAGMREVVEILGGVDQRREFETEKGVSPSFLQRFAGEAFPKPVVTPQKTADEVTNELFDLAPGSAVRPIP